MPQGAGVPAWPMRRPRRGQPGRIRPLRAARSGEHPACGCPERRDSHVRSPDFSQRSLAVKSQYRVSMPPGSIATRQPPGPRPAQLRRSIKTLRRLKPRVVPAPEVMLRRGAGHASCGADPPQAVVRSPRKSGSSSSSTCINRSVRCTDVLPPHRSPPYGDLLNPADHLVHKPDRSSMLPHRIYSGVDTSCIL